MKRFTTIITILAIMLLVSGAVVYGIANSGCKGNSSTGYFESLNDYDWSKTCPGASCRGDE